MRAPALVSIALLVALQIAAFCIPLIIGSVAYASQELQTDAVREALNCARLVYQATQTLCFAWFAITAARAKDPLMVVLGGVAVAALVAQSVAGKTADGELTNIALFANAWVPAGVLGAALAREALQHGSRFAWVGALVAVVIVVAPMEMVADHLDWPSMRVAVSVTVVVGMLLAEIACWVSLAWATARLRWTSRSLRSTRGA